MYTCPTSGISLSTDWSILSFSSQLSVREQLCNELQNTRMFIKFSVQLFVIALLMACIINNCDCRKTTVNPGKTSTTESLEEIPLTYLRYVNKHTTTKQKDSSTTVKTPRVDTAVRRRHGIKFPKFTYCPEGHVRINGDCREVL